MAVMKREEYLANVGAAGVGAAAGFGGAGDLLLGGGVEFEGKLTFEGTVRIDSKFTGSITTKDVLLIGDKARINAEITCGTVIIHGEVNGNIKATTAVELHHPAKVRGNIEAPSISIEKGVFFQGESRMESHAKAAPVKSATTNATATT